MIFCKECKNLSKSDAEVRRKYVDTEYQEPKDWSRANMYYDRAYGRICEHPCCFETTERVTPMEVVRNTIRVKGQAQLNKNNDCPYFQSSRPEPTPPKARVIIEGVDPRKTNPGLGTVCRGCGKSECECRKSSWFKFW